jgi:hypothetical protein
MSETTMWAVIAVAFFASLGVSEAVKKPKTAEAICAEQYTASPYCIELAKKVKP